MKVPNEIDLVKLRIDLENTYPDSYIESWEKKYFPKGTFGGGESIVTGGMRGGSCWSDCGPCSFETYDEPTLESIIKILVSYKIEEEFSKEIVEDAYVDTVSSDDNSDYYGNYDKYETKMFDINKLMKRVEDELHSM